MGGWGMYPTLFFGVLALGAAVRYAVAPDGARLLLVGILSAVNLTAGALGCITGVMTSIQYAAGQPNQWSLIALGTQESLHCVALALMLLVLTGMVTAIGAFRTPGHKREPARAPVVVTS
jgi:hypothetical protein